MEMLLCCCLGNETKTERTASRETIPETTQTWIERNCTLCDPTASLVSLSHTHNTRIKDTRESIWAKKQMKDSQEKTKHNQRKEWEETLLSTKYIYRNGWRKTSAAVAASQQNEDCKDNVRHDERHDRMSLQRVWKNEVSWHSARHHPCLKSSVGEGGCCTKCNLPPMAACNMRDDYLPSNESSLSPATLSYFFFFFLSFLCLLHVPFVYWVSQSVWHNLFEEL